MLSRCPSAIGVTRRAIPSCCRGFVCYVCAFITRAQRAGISDTCDAASGRCCVQTTPAAAAFGGTLAGWPPPRSRLFGEEASKLGGRGSVQVPFPQMAWFCNPCPPNRAGGRHWEAFLSPYSGCPPNRCTVPRSGGKRHSGGQQGSDFRKDVGTSAIRLGTPQGEVPSADKASAVTARGIARMRYGGGSSPSLERHDTPFFVASPEKWLQRGGLERR